MLLAVEHAISAEDYDGALKQIDAIKAVNPWQPEAWAYTAVIANLRNQADTETSARALMPRPPRCARAAPPGAGSAAPGP